MVQSPQSSVPGPVTSLNRFETSTHILRFARSERWMHWAIAVPFLISYTTALVLVLVYNADRMRPYRDLVSGIHRLSGVALVVLPLLAALFVRGDLRLHFHNIGQAWTWMFDDFRWLARIFLANFSDKIELPEQGKFNAGEKLNFMVLLVTYPLYVLTGILIWITHVHILAWLMHFFMAALATPLILGHMYMAVLSRSGRPGLQGMISGFVDRQWAKHHYRRWYREHHEASESIGTPSK
ncbi:MAG: cytochrome b/b6 domain-containing protein [Bryobacteraceae bacterium]